MADMNNKLFALAISDHAKGKPMELFYKELSESHKEKVCQAFLLHLKFRNSPHNLTDIDRAMGNSNARIILKPDGKKGYSFSVHLEDKNKLIQLLNVRYK